MGKKKYFIYIYISVSIYQEVSDGSLVSGQFFSPPCKHMLAGVGVCTGVDIAPSRAEMNPLLQPIMFCLLVLLCPGLDVWVFLPVSSVSPS